jgi:hypothetical protein
MGKRKVKLKERVSLATEHMVSYAKYKQRVNGMLKCNSGCEVERSSKSQCPMAKDMRRKAKGSSNEFRIKKEKQNI